MDQIKLVPITIAFAAKDYSILEAVKLESTNLDKRRFAND